MFAKAPTLAWILTALACFLVGMLVNEGRRVPLVVALPEEPAIGLVATGEVARPTATPVVPPTATPASPCDPTAPGAPRFGCTGNAVADRTERSCQAGASPPAT
jgi:hypothetical protein